MTSTLMLTLLVVSIALIVVLTSKFKCNIFLSMFLVSLGLGLLILPVNDVVPVIKEGFGNTLKSIGIIILLGIMIGALLEKTGATRSMATTILRLTGKKRADLSIAITGFITGIPIFCDSGFIVMSGLNRALVRRTGKPMVYMATLLATGLYSVHCLIPPHPGAMAAAGLMRADIGYQIWLGVMLAIPGAAAGFAWARWMCRNLSRCAADESVGDPPLEIEALPSTFRSFLPIAVPLLLLSARSIIICQAPSADGFAMKALKLLGTPEIALLVGVGLAASLLKRMDGKVLNELFDTAIDKAAPILVLTGAGGIFGAIIKATGAGQNAGVWLAGSGLGLAIPFLIAALLKTALGSSTVAVMTAASIVAQMLPALRLESESGRLLATLAMGAGSMVVSHANDSFFWVVTRFSDLDVGETLRVFTSTTLVVGVTVFLTILLCAQFLL